MASEGVAEGSVGAGDEIGCPFRHGGLELGKTKVSFYRM